jgi:hypothetical protein
VFVDWVAEWLKEVAWVEDAESIAWLKDRPPIIKEMMLKFPPSCVVKANRPLHCPAPGGFAIVTSYFEPSEEKPNGLISVRNGPEGDTRHQCQPEWLEVVGYWQGVTPERLQHIFGMVN